MFSLLWENAKLRSRHNEDISLAWMTTTSGDFGVPVGPICNTASLERHAWSAQMETMGTYPYRRHLCIECSTHWPP
jgi:hypothetical protein